MPTLLTCDCGARFEVDDHLAGREVSCPECLQPIKPTARQAAAPKLDWLALLSVALALIGAFTLVGTVAAAALGATSLVRIRRKPDQFAGTGFALAGVALGLALSAVTFALASASGNLPVAAWLRQRRLSGHLAPASTPAGTNDGVCFLGKPPAGWSVLTRGTSGDPAVDDMQQKRDAVLVNPGLRAYADLLRDSDRDEAALVVYFDHVRDNLLQPRKPLLGDDHDENPLRAAVSAPTDVSRSKLEAVDGFDGYEWVYDQKRGGTVWRCLTRIYRKPRTKETRASAIYVVRVYAPRGRFVAGEKEMRALADAVRFNP